MSTNLKDKAIIIRDEVIEGENTAQRVGSWLVEASDELYTKAPLVNTSGDKVVYAPDGVVPIPDMSGYIINGQNDGDVNIVSDEDISVSGNGTASILAEKSVNISSGASSVNVGADVNVNLKAGGDVNIAPNGKAYYLPDEIESSDDREIAVKGNVPNLKRSDVFTSIGGGSWVDMPLVWQNGYYVDLNGAVLGGGTNSLYKLSELISVRSGEQYRATLQAGNLLAVSGWNNGTFNNSIAIVGTDTNNPAEYSFTISTGITHIRLTCRVELASPRLSKYDTTGGTEINRIDVLEDQVERLSNSNVVDRGVIASFADFAGNNTITGNGTFFGGGRFDFQKNIATEDLDFVAKIKVNTLGQFGVCRADTSGHGTALVVNGNKVEVRRITNTSVGIVVYTFDLPFFIIAGKTYVVRFYKRNKDVVFSILSEDLEYYADTAIYTTARNIGRNWGYPTVFCQTGQIEIKDAFLRNGRFEDDNLFSAGDSFIEGWGIVNNLDKRYIALLQQASGGNVSISGRGGETTTTLLARFDTELSKFTGKYVLLAIGTNDSVINAYRANMAALIGKVKAANKTPILVTVTPRSGFPITDMNAFVRTSGELYIDMNKAVNNGTETVWNPLFVNSDNVHPNIPGNEVMFTRMLFDLPFLIDTYEYYNLGEEVDSKDDTDDTVDDVKEPQTIVLSDIEHSAT